MGARSVPEPIDEARDRGLPQPPTPMGAYRAAVGGAGLIFSAGLTPRRDGELIVTGKVDHDVDIDTAKSAAGLAARNALSALADFAGGIENVGRLLQMTVYIACDAEFTAHSAVADGASAALVDVLGTEVTVARVAVGVISLPGGAPVEVQLVAVARDCATPG